MRLQIVLVTAIPATFFYSCEAMVATNKASKRSLRSYDMNDENDEERMIKLDTKQKIDDLFGNTKYFEKLFDPAKADEYLAGGKKLGGWVDKKLLDDLDGAEIKKLGGKFDKLNARGMTPDEFEKLLSVNVALKKKYERISNLYRQYVERNPPKMDVMHGPQPKIERE